MQSSPSVSQLSPKQSEVLEALLSGSTISHAAELTGVHRSTIHLWCRGNTIFRAALRDAQSQQANLVLDGLRNRANRALETLEEIMIDPAAPASVRLKAATIVIRTVIGADPYSKPQEPGLTTGTVDHIAEAGSRVETQENSSSAPEAVPSDANVPRSAPCPCGSGEKFKRCCGRTAPGVLHQARAA